MYKLVWILSCREPQWKFVFATFQPHAASYLEIILAVPSYNGHLKYYVITVQRDDAESTMIF
jgi:hypothetical protein